jgi:glutamate-ammonia-ligase adenylyltransferase
VSQLLARMEERDPKILGRLEADIPLAEALVAVLGASRSMARLCQTDPGALDVLAHLDRRPSLDPSAGAPGLVAWKHLELMRIAARDLLGLDNLEVVGAALARLADDVVSEALRLVGGAQDLAVVGMGKLGANELNYSSDVDLMFVGEDGQASAARAVLEMLGLCYRVDTTLRPEGRAGALVRSLASYVTYWERWVEPWELQALLKARPVGGDPVLGAEFAIAAAEAIWSRPWGVAEIRQARDMKARTEAVLTRRGVAEREVKSGPGGIRDVEFSVQLLQLVHGRSDPALRAPSTLAALAELGRAGYISPEDAQVMEASYRFLRTVEHRLQLVEERQVHTVPADRLGRRELARVLGYRDRASASALASFDDELRRHRSAAREVHERLYFRPLLEAFAILPSAAPGMGATAVSERLAAFGFSDAARTRAALTELTRGLTRSSRLMAQMLPLVLSWLSEEPDPEAGLLRLRTLADGAHRRALLVSTFRDSPLAARRLCRILGTSGPLHELLRHEPALIPTLGDDAALVLAGRAELVGRARAVVSSAESPSRALLRFKRVQLLRIATRDLLGLDDVEATGAALSTLAEVVLEVALEAVDRPGSMAIIAMGRLGGAELSYASDLDLLVVLPDGGNSRAGEAAAEALLHLLHGGANVAEQVYRVDSNLRPEGRQGQLARTLSAYATYYERWAGTWERQALVRARPVAGDPGLGAAFGALVDRFVWETPFGEDDARQIRRLKARIERERVPPGEDPQFHLKLGPGALADVEWTAQLLQLAHKVRSPGTMNALAALAAAGVLDRAEYAVLTDAYRRCEQIRNRWALMGGTPTDSLPVVADGLAALAHSLDTTPAELRQGYRRVTRRARRVVRGRFYGMGTDQVS